MQVYSAKMIKQQNFKLFLRTGIIFFCTEKLNARIGMNADLADKNVLELSDLFKVKEKYDHQFPRLSPYHGFCCIFPYCGEFIGKPIHFPYAEVCHRMGKKHPYYGKSMIINFPDFPHTMGFVAFSRTVGKLWGNPCTSHMMTSVNIFLC